MSVRTDDDLARIKHDAMVAAMDWLDEHPVFAPDGRPMVWPDGRPVAFDVLRIIAAIEATDD